MKTSQYILSLGYEMVVDLFAGGGGASTGIEQALGRHVDIAINHAADAVALHEANHPQTRHYVSDVFEVDPVLATGGQAVGLLHASPDCTHHSQARGGQPRSRAIRSLSWVVHRWAGKVRPRVITLENVEQILQWSPLVAKRCPKTGRVLRLDGSVAPAGERTPIDQQFLVPDTSRKGHNWEHFVAGLRRMGYAVQWRTLVAADYGAPTTRRRLFLIARCDGQPIVWPEPTHAKRPAPGRKRWRAAAECIDWTIPCPSIFERERPLAEATLRRIAKGVRKYVLEAAKPFIVATGQQSGSDRTRAADAPLSTVVSKAEHCLVAPTLQPLTHQGSARSNDPADPLPTITAAHRGELSLAAATLIQASYGEREGQQPRALDIEQPLGTVVAGGIKHAVASAVLVGAGGAEYSGKPAAVADPLGTVMATCHKGLASAMLVQASHGEGSGSTARWGHGANDIEGPAGTITASGSGGQALGVAYLAQMNGGHFTGAGREATEPMSTVTAAGSQQQLVAAMLTHAYSSNTCGGEGDLQQPAKTITTGGHHAVVECKLAPEHEAGALRVAAFLMRYYGQGGQDGDVAQPASTITTKDRLALVTVTIKGRPFVVVDIGLRMLQPRELYSAQGFPPSYVIDHRADGTALSKSAQVRMCGNSVSPPPMAAIVRANYSDAAVAAERVAA